MSRIFKRLSVFLILLTLVSNLVFAQDALGSVCDNVDLVNVRQTPFIVILCPVSRLLNILILSSGVIFAIFIVIGFTKLSLAMGEPKAYDGAKWSLFYSAVGFVIILGAFNIIKIVVDLFIPGQSNTFFSGPNTPLSGLKTAIEAFNCFIYSDYGTMCPKQ